MQPPKHFTVTLLGSENCGEGIKRFRFRMDAPLAFVPGQYVSLRFPGETRYHAFSIASSPMSGELELVVKIEHEFTTHLFSSAPGTVLECMGPMGRFLQSITGDLVMVAGGVGVTPFLSMMRWARDTKREDREYWLFYSCRTRDQLGFEDELRRLPAQNPHIHIIMTLTREQPEGWDQELGHVDKAMLLRHLGKLDDQTFATCGPNRMVTAIIQALNEVGIPPERVLHESWG